MIYYTGDLHGPLEILRLNSKNFLKGETLTKNDYVIVLGDFGLVWDVNESKKSEQHWQLWLKNRPWTTLFIDGNHENFDRINKLPQTNMFGSKVGVLNESTFHLKRGEVYIIDGKKFFTFGGGNSMDKEWRTEYISWWKEEMPSEAEYKKGIKTLEKYNWKVDYVLTHACPTSIFYILCEISQMEKTRNQLTDYFEMLKDKLEFKEWHFGHYHMVGQIDNFYANYKNIGEIK